jgi:hypothetical protein
MRHAGLPVLLYVRRQTSLPSYAMMVGARPTHPRLLQHCIEQLLWKLDDYGGITPNKKQGPASHQIKKLA